MRASTLAAILAIGMLALASTTLGQNGAQAGMPHRASAILTEACARLMDTGQNATGEAENATTTSACMSPQNLTAPTNATSFELNLTNGATLPLTLDVCVRDAAGLPPAAGTPTGVGTLATRPCPTPGNPWNDTPDDTRGGNATGFPVTVPPGGNATATVQLVPMVNVSFVLVDAGVVVGNLTPTPEGQPPPTTPTPPATPGTTPTPEETAGDTPGLPLAALLATVAAGALAMRRRR